MSATNIITSKLSSDEVHQQTVATTASVTTNELAESGQGASAQSNPVQAVELVNYGTAVAHFNCDGATATASDRVLQVGERLMVARNVSTVNLYCATTTTVEVNFMR